MDIRQIKTFITIAKLNNFTQAANELGYAQSSITSQIQLLEKELGVQLFERLGKNISLTSQGEDFLIYSKQLINLWEKAKGDLLDTGVPKGRLIIGADELTCGYKIPNLLKEYSRRYPEVEVIIKIGTACEMESQLRENEVDVAIVLDSKITEKDLIVEMEHDEPFALLTSSSNVLAQKEHIDIEDFSKYQLLLAGQGCSWEELFKKELEGANITLKLMLYKVGVHTIKQFVINGFGMTLLPLYTISQELEEN